MAQVKVSFRIFFLLPENHEKCRCGRSRGRDLNRGFHEYEAELLATLSQGAECTPSSFKEEGDEQENKLQDCEKERGVVLCSLPQCTRGQQTLYDFQCHTHSSWCILVYGDLYFGFSPSPQIMTQRSGGCDLALQIWSVFTFLFNAVCSLWVLWFCGWYIFSHVSEINSCFDDWLHLRVR